MLSTLHTHTHTDMHYLEYFLACMLVSEKFLYAFRVVLQQLHCFETGEVINRQPTQACSVCSTHILTTMLVTTTLQQYLAIMSDSISFRLYF